MNDYRQSQTAGEEITIGKEKICPLIFFNCGSNPYLTNCKGKECAWWNEKYECCAILRKNVYPNF